MGMKKEAEEFAQDSQESSRSTANILNRVIVVDPLPRVLIVDDNMFNLMTMQYMLEDGLGIKSDKAMNGEQAIRMIKNRNSHAPHE